MAAKKQVKATKSKEKSVENKVSDYSRADRIIDFAITVGSVAAMVGTAMLAAHAASAVGMKLGDSIYDGYGDKITGMDDIEAAHPSNRPSLRNVKAI